MKDLQQLYFAFAHSARFPLSLFMIEPEKVKQSVHQQPVDFPPDRFARVPRLTLGNGQGYHDVPEHVALNRAELPFPEREGQHVRGPVFSAVAAVQRPHGPVPDKQDAQLGIIQPHREQKLSKPRPYGPLYGPPVLQGAFYQNYHCVFSLPEIQCRDNRSGDEIFRLKSY